MRPLRLLLWLAALAMLGSLLAFFAFRSALVLAAPFQVEYGEGPTLAWAQQLASGTLPYKAIAPEPWAFSVYAPGFLAASGALSRLLSANPWLAGRLLSFGSALLLAALLVRWPTPVQRHGGWLAALLWLASPYLFRWATFFRPDLFALLWSALGLWVAQRAVARERRGWLVVAALCFVLSFWSKQSFFAAPLAALLWLAGQRRAWLPWLLLPGAAAGGAVALALWLATGGAIGADLLAANANPFSWAALWHFQLAFARTVPLIALLALWGVRARPSPSLMLVALYAALAMLVTLSVGKAGAWENYFLEPLWALCALAAPALARGLAAPGRAGLALPALLLLQGLLFAGGLERHSPTAERAWLADVRAENRALAQALAALPNGATVWSEQMGALAEAQRPLLLHSFVYTQLERQGLWNPQPLTDALATGRGTLLIQRSDALADPLARDRWSRAMLDASERGWALGERAGQWQLRPSRPFPAPDGAWEAGGGFRLVDWMALPCHAGNCDAAPLPAALVAGQPWSLHLLWQSAAGEAQPLSASVQLFAPDGSRVAQHDGPLRGWGLGGAWPAGALVRDEHPLDLPPALPPGPYSLLATLYETETGQGRAEVRLEGLKVPLPAAAAPAVRRDVPFGAALHLLGHAPLPDRSSPGTALTVELHWQRRAPLDAFLTTVLHLVAPDGTVAAQVDWPPPYGPQLWSLGEVVPLRYTLLLPASLPPGDYALRVGWYDGAGQRQPPDTGAVEGLFRLGEVVVESATP